MKRLKKHTVLLLIFSAVFIVYFNSKVVTQYDSRWYIPTALSIIREGNTDLNEYGQIGKGDYRVVRVNGNFYLKQSVGPALIALPFVFAADKGLHAVFSLFPALKEYIKERISGRLGYAPSNIVDYIMFSSRFELFLASLIVAVTAVFVYLIATLFLDGGYSLLVTFIFAFCTSAWSTVSRGLWQHGPSMLILSLTLYLILLAKENPRLIQFTGASLALSYLMRPANALSVLLLTVFVLIQYKRYALLYFIWMAVIALPFTLYNFIIYHSFPAQYYVSWTFLKGKGDLWRALMGNLISPARGLFIYSPIILFSIAGWILKLKNRQLVKLDYFLCAIILLHWIMMSSIYEWWGGHSFGPRYFSDMLPYLAYLLIPVAAVMPSLKGIKKAAIVSVFSICVIFSFFVHYRGATVLDVYLWNSQPNNINFNPSRLWDWSDIQFLRGI